MQTKATQFDVEVEEDSDDRFVALRELGLGEEELAALSQQGFISREDRLTSHSPIYRLRFRIQGRQRTRYLGSDEAFVGQVRDQLALLQAKRQGQRRLQSEIRNGWQSLRKAKGNLEPLLDGRGYHFHGLTVRRRRVPGGEPHD